MKSGSEWFIHLLAKRLRNLPTSGRPTALLSLLVAMRNWSWFCPNNAPRPLKKENVRLFHESGGISTHERNALPCVEHRGIPILIIKEQKLRGNET